MGAGTDAEVAPLAADLADIGVHDPERVIAENGPTAARVALRRFDERTARWQPANPGGYFVTLLKELTAKPQILAREAAEIDEAPPAEDRGYIGDAWRGYPGSPWTSQQLRTWTAGVRK